MPGTRRMFTDKQKARYVAEAQEIGNVERAAAKFGIQRSILDRWFKKMGEKRPRARDNGTSANAHSPKFRAKAMALAGQIGATAAANKLKINPSLIYNWRRRTQPNGTPQPRRRTQPNGTPQPRRRTQPNGTPQPQPSNGAPNGHDSDGQVGFILGLITGHIEAEIEGYARGTGVSATVLTSRLARLLQRKANRQVLGTQHQVPGL